MNSTTKQNIMLGLAAVAIMAAIAWVSLRSAGPAEESPVAAALAADVLSPTIFDDERTRAAYQAANDIPEVLSQLPCFCGCMTSIGHKNNLFCFKDQHGSGCTLCQDIALDARRMHDQGMSITQIQDNINTRYARYQP